MVSVDDPLSDSHLVPHSLIDSTVLIDSGYFIPLDESTDGTYLPSHGRQVPVSSSKTDRSHGNYRICRLGFPSSFSFTSHVHLSVSSIMNPFLSVRYKRDLTWSRGDSLDPMSFNQVGLS